MEGVGMTSVSEVVVGVTVSGTTRASSEGSSTSSLANMVVVGVGAGKRRVAVAVIGDNVPLAVPLVPVATGEIVTVVVVVGREVGTLGDGGIVSVVVVVDLDAGTAIGKMDPMDEVPGSIRVAVCVTVGVEVGEGVTEVVGEATEVTVRGTRVAMVTVRLAVTVVNVDCLTITVDVGLAVV